jgi:hypothetical protein
MVPWYTQLQLLHQIQDAQVLNFPTVETILDPQERAHIQRGGGANKEAQSRAPQIKRNDLD